MSRLGAIAKANAVARRGPTTPNRSEISKRAAVSRKATRKERERICGLIMTAEHAGLISDDICERLLNMIEPMGKP